ncbi:alpha/beta hydrolase [Mesorhizobium sp. M4A.F.Ca.ET.050.02.1.1]|uniref:alpha/beta fold hydrolase n=1 Tax=Mesorhizobium sp. M4A.F.Ca.ET.050.02.1.1 TaxID=2496754 RepID=UPI000FCC9CC9|nr:alpha/beta hydrolase [Mesorhizobium sp. M4A.F.Ca.ET.050.02.1.1]RUX51280.1 alpha/beta hydrolase [Mesorhizobium sp. M4A.F.Ca.ET.050.02.1.1]
MTAPKDGSRHSILQHAPVASPLTGASSQSSAVDKYLTPRAFTVRMSEHESVRVYEVGPPDVPVVIGIHGTPSSGVNEVLKYVATGPVFCRLVTFDRQGYGCSTPKPGRKVRDIAPIIEAVLDRLSLNVAAVYGVSGGGPHALAAAALLPDRISRVASCGGIGPNFGQGFDYMDGQILLARQEMLAARSDPDALREFYRRYIVTMDMPDVEKEWFSQNDIHVSRFMREVMAPLKDRIEQHLNIKEPLFSQEDAYIDDFQSFASPWGFDLGSIGVSARFFHGLADIMVPPRHSEWLQSQIPNAGLELFPNLGHTLSQIMPHVFAWLVGETPCQGLRRIMS